MYLTIFQHNVANSAHVSKYLVSLVGLGSYEARGLSIIGSEGRGLYSKAPLRHTRLFIDLFVLRNGSRSCLVRIVQVFWAKAFSSRAYPID
jgi:hypothetical protein